MKIDFKKQLDLSINFLQRSIEKKIPLLFAENYSNLLFAEENNYIKRSWRSKVNVEKGLQMIREENDHFLGNWLENYRMLKQITEYQGGFGWEEIIRILGLRSTLESSWSLISEEDQKNLIANCNVDMDYIDELLASALKRGHKHLDSCRNMSTLGFEALNPT